MTGKSMNFPYVQSVYYYHLPYYLPYLPFGVFSLFCFLFSGSLPGLPWFPLFYEQRYLRPCKRMYIMVTDSLLSPKYRGVI